MKFTRKHIVFGGIAASVLLGGGAIALQPDPSTVKLENPQQIVWDKPTTDAEWAEDVKAESFDIKSTGKLTEMRDAHVAKLQLIKTTAQKVIECPECIRYEIKETNPQLSVAEIEAEYLDDLAQYTWDVEKLAQSIERMNNELRLRDEGFVTVKGEQELLFGGLKKPYAIRTPRD